MPTEELNQQAIVKLDPDGRGKILIYLPTIKTLLRSTHQTKSRLFQ